MSIGTASSKNIKICNDSFQSDRWVYVLIHQSYRYWDAIRYQYTRIFFCSLLCWAVDACYYSSLASRFPRKDLSLFIIVWLLRILTVGKYEILLYWYFAAQESVLHFTFAWILAVASEISTRWVATVNHFVNKRMHCSCRFTCCCEITKF